MKRKTEENAQEGEEIFNDVNLTQWLPNNEIPDAHDVPELMHSESTPSYLSQSLSTRLDNLFPNDFVQLTMASFQNSFSQQMKSNNEFDFSLKTLSFESLPRLESSMQIPEKVEVNIVPVTTNNEDPSTVTKFQQPAMTLRPKRKKQSSRMDYFADSDYSEDEGNDSKSKSDIKEADENKENIDDSITSRPRKKRAYYRKNKHPKEVLEKIEAERLKRKRLKNRELAARSRKRKKEKMDTLEQENADLKKKVSLLKDQLRKCVCNAKR